MVHFIFYKPLSIHSHTSLRIPVKLRYGQIYFVDDKSFSICHFPTEISFCISTESIQIALVCRKLQQYQPKNAITPGTEPETQIFASIFMYFLVCITIDFHCTLYCQTDTIYCQTIIMKQTQSKQYLHYSR